MSYAQPRWSTPRTPGRPTYGKAIRNAARALGRPLLPWQEDVADVIGEVVPDVERGGWRMAYPVVVLIVPRRAGKTVLELAVKTQRCGTFRDHRAWYTAQTGGDAGGKFRKDWVPAFAAPGIKKLVDKPRLSNGSEGIGFRRTGSRIGIFAPTETALHGEDSDDVTVDEAWAFDRLRGGLIEAAVRPTMATRQLRQLRIVSAGGTAESTWLLDWRERGRATAGEADQGIAYFEWHPAVDELGAILDDLDDPATWAATHPNVGEHGLITLDTLREDWKTMRTPEGDRGLFYRSYLDVFTGSTAPRIYPRQEWIGCKDPELALPLGYGLTLAYDVSPDQRHASVSLAKRLDETRVGAEVVEVEADDPQWLADRVEQLSRRYGAQLVADSVGPATATTRELRQRGLYVKELDTTEALDAASGLLADVLAARDRSTGGIRPEGGRFVHRGQRQLDEAADVAVKRTVGDRWAITRRGSEGDVTPLTSVAFAVQHAKTYPIGELGPLVEFATAP